MILRYSTIITFWSRVSQASQSRACQSYWVNLCIASFVHCGFCVSNQGERRVLLQIHHVRANPMAQVKIIGQQKWDVLLQTIAECESTL